MSQIVPAQSEQRVVIEVTKREALVIQEIRGFGFGKIIIHKANGQVIRIEPQVSKLIDEKLDLTIPIVEQEQS